MTHGHRLEDNATRATRCLLLAGVSAGALVAAMPPLAFAGSINGLWTPHMSPPATAAAAAQAAAAAASAAAQQAQASLAASLAAVQKMQQAQAAAQGTLGARLPTTATSRRNLVLPPPPPDGLVSGGLVPHNPTDPISPWQGANPNLTTTTSNGQTTVTVQQTDPKAVLTWDSFNIGANTTLDFSQQSSTWEAFNRVLGSTSPSYILGHIQAPGSVYVYNANGIIFGSGSQVDVHSLIASALDVGGQAGQQESILQRNQFFLNNGIATATPGTSFSFSSHLAAGSGSVDGDITVLPGATITAHPAPESPDAPGFVYLFGANVTNSGTITSPAGEVALVGARTVTLLPKQYDHLDGFQGGGFIANNVTSILGTGFVLQPYGGFSFGGGKYGLNEGSITNDGLIATPRGITVLNGDRITMSGVISADTSISRNSQIFLDAVTSLNVTGTISVQPFIDGDTVPLVSSTAAQSGQNSVAAFTPAAVEMSAFQVTLGPQALISAPGAHVAVTAVGAAGAVGNFLLNPNTSSLPTNPVQQIVMQPGSVIDVAGLQNVELPASYNIIPFTPRGGEFANEPLERNGPLLGQTLWIDIRNTGTRSDGSAWVGTPVADASGFVGLVGQDIRQLLTAGGTVSLNAALPNGSTQPGGQVLFQHGSTINVGGGYVQFLSGMVNTSLLIGSDGKIYDVSQAYPNQPYLGIFSHQFTVVHMENGVPVTQTFGSAATQVFQPGYIEGHAAGSVSVQAATPILQGTLLFGAPIGSRQAANGQVPSQGSFALATPNSVILTNNAPDLVPANTPNNPDFAGAHFTPTSNTPPIFLATSQFSGLSDLSITANDVYVPAASTLTLAVGGAFNVSTAGAIDVAGSIVAPSGSINFVTDNFRLGTTGYLRSTTASGQQSIFIEGTLDARGRWINDFGVTANNASGPSFINGGNISLQTNDSDNSLTGSIMLANTSLLDVSGGGYLSRSDVLTPGAGGNITLSTYQGTTFNFNPSITTTDPLAPTDPASAVIVQLGGTLRDYGFSTGGTLTIGTPFFQIGGQPSSDPVTAHETLYLQPSFFETGGFGSYVLQSPTNRPFGGGLTLAANETVTLRQQNFSNTFDYSGVPTGANVGRVTPLVTLPDDIRQPVNLTFSSGNTLLDTGSRILADPRATITLSISPPNTPNKSLPDPAPGLLMLGSIIDHGGSLLVLQFPYVLLGSSAKIDLSGTFIPNSDFGFTAGASQSGTLVGGGTVSFDTSTPSSKAGGTPTVLGAVIAESGALIDVSGAAAEITGRVGPKNQPSAGLFTRVPSWSDGGTVSFNTETLLWDGTFKADAGAPQGNRGTLMIGGSTIALEQRPDDQSLESLRNLLGGVNNVHQAISLIESGQFSGLPAPATPSDVAALGSLLSNPTAPVPVIIAASQMAGFDTVYLYGGVYGPTGGVSNGLGFFSASVPSQAATNPVSPVRLPVNIYGNVDWLVENRLFIEGSAIVGQTPGASVNISANYVMLTSGDISVPQNVGGFQQFVREFAPPLAPPAGDSRMLKINGQTIDIQSAVLSDFSDVTFNSAGDIRLMSPPVDDFFGVPALATSINNPTVGQAFGTVLAAGNLTFSAERIYPVSAVDFQIASIGPQSTVRFEVPAGSSAPPVPLSVGGSLEVSAWTIIQNGNLYAPLGQITLGAETSGDLSPNTGGNTTVVVNGTVGAPWLLTSFVHTNTVTLMPGSTTSVSLGNNVVPFGETQDGTNWFYNEVREPLSAPPDKSLRLVGSSINLSSGANVDLRGGGDLLAFEFVAGTGGTKDVLSNLEAGTANVHATTTLDGLSINTNTLTVGMRVVDLTASGNIPSGTTIKAINGASSITLSAAGNASSAGDQIAFLSPKGQTVYAILPQQQQDKVGAFDTHFNSNLGDPSPLAGQQVFLNGGNGIPAGWYTLYPAHYATLPGAMRVVDFGNTLSSAVAPGTTLLDGTQIIGGHIGQAGLGLQSSGTELFAVQTSTVWRQYSEIDPSSANTYFTAKAAHDGVPVPPLPIDGGRLAVAAQNALLLQATALAQPAAGGRGGELDISSLKIALLDNAKLASAQNDPRYQGYVLLNVNQLDALAAGGLDSILIGGQRTTETNGTLITATASKVVVDSATPLVAPEIILAAIPQTQPSGFFFPTGEVNTPVAGTGNVTIKDGSIIETTGSGSAAGQTYLVGSNLVAALGHDPATLTPFATLDPATSIITVDLTAAAAVSGATVTSIFNTLANYTSLVGASSLLLVSDNQNTTLTQRNATGTPVILTCTTCNGPPLTLPAVTGTLSIGANVQIGAASNPVQQLALSATGTMSVASSAQINAASIALSAPSIGVGDAAAGTGTAAPLPSSIVASLTSANTNTLTLRAFSGNIDLYTSLGSLAPTKAVQNLTLDASSLVGQGTDITIGSANTLTLVNTGTGSPSTAQASSGSTLTLNTREIDLGGGNMSIAGFGAMNWTAADRVFVQGAGTLQLGADAAPSKLAITTPLLLVGSGSSGASGVGTQFALTTSGQFTLSGNGTVPAPSSEVGGNLLINAADITLNRANIQAASGELTLHATGNVSVGNSLISAPGFAQVMFDVTKYGPGGKVVLTSDSGDVFIDAASRIDVGQPAGGLGAGGELDISAVKGTATLLGSFNMAGDPSNPATGGIFHLDTNQTNSLDSLAQLLTAAGATGEINIHTRSGSLILDPGFTLTAQTVSLTADDSKGQITINQGAVVDASGTSGGTISLYARSVDIEGSLLATASDPSQKGGTVNIGTTGTADGTLNPVYGYENVQASNAGTLTIGQNAKIDLSVNGALAQAGVVNLRVPLLADGTVNFNFSANPTNIRASAVNLEAYAVWSTDDPMTVTGAHFDGVIDPAGKFTTASVNNPTVLEPSGSLNADHIGFYDGGTAPGNFALTGIATNQVLLPSFSGPVFVTLTGGTFVGGGSSGTVSGTLLMTLSDGAITNVTLTSGTVNGTAQTNFDLSKMSLSGTFTNPTFGTLVNFVQRALLPVKTQVNAILLGAGFQPSNTMQSIFHLQPGIELRNPDQAIENGDIGVVSNWNLAAGVVSNLQKSSNNLLSSYPGIPSYQYFQNIDADHPDSDATSMVTFFYRFGIEPGDLTLRAVRDVNVLASISDGFFDYQNLYDPTYQNYLPNARPFMPLPPAPVPTAAGANSISPTATSLGTSLQGYDLFPDQFKVIDNTTGKAEVTGVNSWSYHLTAGADIGLGGLASANPNAVAALSTYADSAGGTLGGHGNVLVHGNFTAVTETFVDNQGFTHQAPVFLPTMVRTGTGSITINAASDVELYDPTVVGDQSVPGVIYTAGRNSPLLPDAQITPALQILNPAGFVEPNALTPLTSGPAAELTGVFAGPTTAAAFPQGAGDIVINAQQDVLGWQQESGTIVPQVGGFPPRLVANTEPQFYQQWLLAWASGTGAVGAGAFAPSPAYVQQTAWWIEFGRFEQGVLSAGGNVTVVAGRDVKDLSVSLPTTARVSGGLSAMTPSGQLNTPTTHLYGSGNLMVRVGGDLDSGAFYEGSGTAQITVGGSVLSDWRNSSTPVSTVLAVDTGQLNLTARDAITISDIVNPANLQSPQFAGSITAFHLRTVALDTYGPSSAVRLTSIGGDVTINYDPGVVFAQNPQTLTYPSIFEVTALRGNIATPEAGFVMTDSQSATLNLLAHGTVDFRGGVPTTASFTATSGSIAAGTSLIDTAFNPYEPNLYDDPSSNPVLAHKNENAALGDDIYDRIYAVTGDILGGVQVAIPRPVLIQAGQDIVDLNVTAQNLRPSDVSRIVAGRDLFYTGNTSLGGIQIAGPGFLDVEAGRDLGPFLPQFADTSLIQSQQGIVSVGNAALSIVQRPSFSAVTLVEFPVGNEDYPIGPPNLEFLGSPFTFATSNNIVPTAGKPGDFQGTQNFLLPATGASIVAMFGVGPGVNYNGVYTTYVDPATAISGNYFQELVGFVNSVNVSLSQLDFANSFDVSLAQLGVAADGHLLDGSAPIASPLLRMFIDKVFFEQLNTVTSSTNAQPGYRAVEAMFPAALGYTQNNIGGGANGAGLDNRRATGNLDLLHATIQTDLGGDVSIFGPGGSISVGSVAPEPNPNLKLNNLGILTLAGGSVDTFTDKDVLVNSSRVFTEQGGDILMWSSNGNLDAGRGSRTTASLNSLAVNIDNNDYQTIDLGGLVTGAGIGTLQTSSAAGVSNVKLLAPNGFIDAGSAGIRSSGSVTVVAPIVLNAFAITASQGVVGVSAVTVPSFGNLTSVSNTAAATTKAADVVPGATSAAGQPSVIIVEVIGYGGGGGEGDDSNQSDTDQEKRKPLQ